MKNDHKSKNNVTLQFNKFMFFLKVDWNQLCGHCYLIILWPFKKQQTYKYK